MDALISTEERKETICIPPSILDPKGKKMGQKVSCKVSGIIKSIGEHGVTIELGEHEENLDEFEKLGDEEQKGKIKEQMQEY